MTNQDNFVYSHLSGVKSTAISTVAYNENTKRLFVRFKSGNEIAYADVPLAEYNALVSASSVGQYYSYNVKGEYTGERLTNARLRKTEAKAKPAVIKSVTPTAVATPTPRALTRFSVAWVDLDNVALSGAPEFQAVNEADALAKFGEAIDAAEAAGFKTGKVKVKSVTRYFD